MNRIWSCEGALELSHYTAHRPFPLHLHATAIVAVMVEGSELLCVDGRAELAETGSIVALDPEQAHLNQPVTPQGARYRGFYIDAPHRFELDALTANVLRDTRVARELVDIHRSLEARPSSEAVAEAKRLISQVFLNLPRAPRARATPEVRFAAQVLRERCTERVSWGSLAREAGAGAAHLARQFHAQRGVSPHLYQTQFRVTWAKDLIRRQVPLARVAGESGFADQSHLTHQFRRYVGLTPGAFARAQDFTRPSRRPSTL